MCGCVWLSLFWQADSSTRSPMASSVATHLDELHALVDAWAGRADSTPTAPVLTVPARDACASIENAATNALDDELRGALSLAFDRARGLPALLRASLERTGSACNEPPLRELRAEALKLAAFLVADASARGAHAHVGAYAARLAGACIAVFRVELDSSVRSDAIATLLAALELRDHAPDLFELSAELFPPEAERDPMVRARARAGACDA